ncbi:hypothetical protein F511_03121 [Dorcoceras hygrometricum]|nr:hypothetical protein F511_03121 [Dorcoceras hygrometricum]
MEDDWDIQAVVRGCSTAAAAAVAIAKASCGQVFCTSHQNHSFCSTGIQPLFEPRKENSVHELQDLYKPFSPQTVFAQNSSTVSPLFLLGGLQDQSAEQQQSLQVVSQKQQLFSLPSVSKPNNPTSRSKRRKNNLKRVCHVPAESLSSDMWSWRKYGQKPIKGSPYPRGYYKCSTLKGCMARKQVERNKSDPGMFIVTYTAEHNHPMPAQRSSLANSARQKPTTPSSNEPRKHTSSPASPVTPSSPAPENPESSRDDRGNLADGDDDDNEVDASNMALEDDFFAGLEDFIVGPVTENFFSDHFPASFQLPWLGHSNTTAAGGG